ncbi:unnamed protein product (macronuclear) [Paramecium tetraurelia]|uniref:Uncharacterized protein n=1 Tax=Paramecium tetraurelia TaxID=5888 RepID=A0C731_PARTE|nr:uncharacterized protein GSPATT00035728001 [Paramecium tetraurelia]CAK66598.1 unnamed protein product [Paramecium tetraurelia]|eukprot:XP_001433995.1 hypothetical protein (macronuclear) [Paramecium tetraurelia strain d4-2]
MQNITKERYRQIQRMQKIQKFQYENDSLKYGIENCVNLNDLIKLEQNKTKCFTIGQLFIITNNIVDQLLKVYQISNLSKLEMDSIYVNNENNEITFTNIHVNKDLVSYEDNQNQIFEISYQFFLKHQEFLISLINEDNRVDLSKKIQYITEFSNQVLDTLKTANYHKELNQFVQKNIKDKQLIHDNFKDVIEIDQYIRQPQALKKVEIPLPNVQQNPQIQQENPQVNNKKIQEQQQQQKIGYQFQQFQQPQYQQRQYQPQQLEYDQSQKLDIVSEDLNIQEQIDQSGYEDNRQGLVQSKINHQFYTFIQGQLENLQLGEELYDFMLNFFLTNFKYLQQDQIVAKIELLQDCYNFPQNQEENCQQDFIKQWQNIITDGFITSKTIDLNEENDQVLSKLTSLYKNLYESQMY